MRMNDVLSKMDWEALSWNVAIWSYLLHRSNTLNHLRRCSIAAGPKRFWLNDILVLAFPRSPGRDLRPHAPPPGIRHVEM